TSHRSLPRRGGAHPLARRNHHPLLRREPVHRAADRSGPGSQLGEAPHRAVTLDGGPRAAPGPGGDRAPRADRARRRAGPGGRAPARRIVRNQPGGGRPRAWPGAAAPALTAAGSAAAGLTATGLTATGSAATGLTATRLTATGLTAAV